MRVLLIDVTCKVGSTGKIVYDLYTELNNQGHVAGIAYGRGPIVNETNIYKFGLDLETYFHGAMNRLTGIHGSFSLISTQRLIKFIENFKPDIIHIHELHGYFVNIVSVLKYLKKTKTKTVWTFHCEYMYEAKGYVYSKEENPNWVRKNEYPSSLFFDLSKWSVKRYKKIFDDISNLIIVSPSEWLAQRTRNTYLAKYEIKVINNGINHEVFKIKNFEYLKSQYSFGDKKIILSVAPNIMEERKGGKNILELSKKLPTNKFQFILIGAENPGLKTPENMLLIPKTQNQDMLADYYSYADYFVIPSSRENFPTTCVESLSCGTPVLGFNRGGTSETAPYPYGKFFEYGDIDSISDYLLNADQNVLASPTDCENYAKQRYSKKTMTSKYIDLYETLS